jgi:hypothetical protein
LSLPDFRIRRPPKAASQVDYRDIRTEALWQSLVKSMQVHSRITRKRANRFEPRGAFVWRSPSWQNPSRSRNGCSGLPRACSSSAARIRAWRQQHPGHLLRTHLPHGKTINISIVLAGQRLGIKEVDDGIGLASFSQYNLGYFNREQKTLQPLDNPFGPRLSPMS